MDVATLLAFDVVPVAIGSYDFGLLPVYAERLNGRPAPPNLGYTPYNLEQLSALEPDLILMYEIFADDESLATLNKLGVPIVVIPTSGYRRQLEIVGAVLAEEAKAVELADATDKLVAEFELPDRPSSIAVIYLESAAGTIGIAGPAGSSAGFMKLIDIPYRVPLPAASIGEAYSMELLGAIDADFVLVQQYEREDAAEQIAGQPLYRTIPAIAAGRYAVLSVAETWAQETADVLSLPLALDVMKRVLSA